MSPGAASACGAPRKEQRLQGLLRPAGPVWGGTLAPPRQVCDRSASRRMPASPMNWLLLALVPACFALNPVIGRALMDAFGPATLSVVRWSLSAAVIAAIATARGPAERWHASSLHMLRIGPL